MSLTKIQRDIKKKLISFLVNRSVRQWKGNKLMKVLIQTNKHGFSRENWEASFRALGVLETYDVQYCNKKSDFIKLSAEANAIFCFYQDRYVDWSRRTLNYIYFGLNGIEFLDETLFHDGSKYDYARGFSVVPIAEYVIATVLLVNRNIHQAAFNQSSRKWDQSAMIETPFVSISDKVIGVMGLGAIGSLVAEKFSRLDCKVLGYNRSVKEALVDICYGLAEFDSFLKEIDVLIITLPLNNETKFLLDKAKLALLKKGTILVNVSRAGIVDNMALEERIDKGELKAILDVFEQEPLQQRSSLWAKKEVLLTPHIAGNVNVIASQIQTDFVSNLKK